MRVLFGAVMCILIDSKILITSAQNSTTTNNFTSTTSNNFTSATPDNFISTTPDNFTSTTPDNFTSTFFTSSATPVYDACTVLDPPINSSVSPDKTAAVLGWTSQQTDLNCLPNVIDVYCEALEDENIEGWQWIKKNSSANNTININDATSVYVEELSEFTNYTCNATLSDGVNTSEPKEIKFRTKEEVPETPDNLTITEKTSTSFTVQWEKPTKNPGVFITYHVHVVSAGTNHFIPESCELQSYDQWNQTTNETYDFDEAVPDYIYEVTVFLENSAGNGSQASINITTNTSASQAPTQFSNTSVLDSEKNVIIRNISWHMPCETNGEIEYFQVDIKGHYISDYRIVDNKTIIVNTTYTERYFTEIELMPAFLYNITVQANGLIEEGDFFADTFVTEDNFPGPPTIEDITEIGANNFTVVWKKPERKAGNITGYMVSIDTLGPFYDTDPKRCPTEQWHYNDSVLGDVLSYTFTKLRPYYLYKVSVAAATAKGYGNYSTINVNTASSAPEKTEELEFVLLDGNITGQVSWRTPCNINGPIKAFNVELEGNYTEDNSSNVNYNWSLTFYNDKYNYNHTINLVEAYHFEIKVWITLEDGTYGLEDRKYLTTPDGYPGPPQLTDITNKTNQSFTISWNRPDKRNGRITDYQVVITPLEALYDTHCGMDDTEHIKNTTGNNTSLTFNEGQPYYNYSVSVKARTVTGWGDVSNLMVAATEPSLPENVENVTIDKSLPTQEVYNAHANISFQPPCRTNGPFSNYELIYHGKRHNYEDIEGTLTSPENSFINIMLRPEYIYEFTIKTKNVNYSSPGYSKSFLAPAGIPQFPSQKTAVELETAISGATITLQKENFDVENGNITFMALILSERNETGGDFSPWESSAWPSIERDGYYQLTEDWWNPFNDADRIQFIIGNETTCNNHGNNCNKPLESGKDYYLIVRLFTRNFYKNSPTIHFRTDDTSKLGLILGVIFGLLIFALLGFAAFFVWRKNLIKLSPTLLARKTSIKPPSDGNTSIPINKFIQYCKHLENNPEKFAEQYMLLTEKSKEMMSTHTTAFAELTENRRKNRYTNILPFDATRVKLLIDEDDEIGSDYINASYIRGYSGNIEYIATQGPLPTTCRDFWKMVIQENVTIIVMVTQFVEENKEKCYKYFPNNHETMTIGDDMEVKCTMELHFGTYCVRSIQVKKDSTQVTVTHMQYLDWPDFNVPKGTGSMLQFCHQLRERLKIEGGYVIVHCSAGVGRTGTLIATDILIQNINAGKNIDIFSTVLELRKQRMIMVQAQKQYIYIYNLIRDTLESQASGKKKEIPLLLQQLIRIK
ncbi:phosphatidylinositol phosphatase PTPRQ isoform X2 [Anoplophora glabripennis]|uniref:phosphatidylinositol phosphatase PTPRQ isoform X2 n=1 Tax=Anoplophora glabripennis TaxID=217634 RepID=UPI0008739277|nr:phosphatidylinositol phosphatase PTPRQ isoform X2 [Anoplophora glabripennis]